MVDGGGRAIPKNCVRDLPASHWIYAKRVCAEIVSHHTMTPLRDRLHLIGLGSTRRPKIRLLMQTTSPSPNLAYALARPTDGEGCLDESGALPSRRCFGPGSLEPSSISDGGTTRISFV